MFPKGTIYKSGKGKDHGEAMISLSKSLRFLYTLLRGLGASLIAWVFLVFLFTYGPIVKQEVSYTLKDETTLSETISTESLVDVASADKVIAIQKETETLGINSYFSLYIPKIDAASNVIANVDTVNEGEYLEALKEGVAHAKGTYFPGQERNIYLFAHSTNAPYNVATYNAVFYLLRKLETGDEVVVYFADEKYIYEVEDKVVVDADDISYITKNYEDERLILQTCDPPGTTWKRLLVIAKPI